MTRLILLNVPNLVAVFVLFQICASLKQTAPRFNATSIAPKFMIISAFQPEADVWYDIPDFNLLVNNITVPGLSPLFPDVHCTQDQNVCQVTTGEGTINAASSIAALVYSPLFSWTKTYFMIAGIAGINPYVGTSADVTFARYGVQVDLQHEIDVREKPDNFSTGYFPQGSAAPDQYPGHIYGTEVFEVNDALRQIAVTAAKTATLNDTTAAQAFRAHYAVGTAARDAPSVRACDSATSDVYFAGELLGEAFSNYTTLATNGSAIYCTSDQEDNAILGALLRGASAHALDFARVIVMRTASDFDRPYPGQSVLQNLVYESAGVSNSCRCWNFQRSDYHF